MNKILVKDTLTKKFEMYSNYIPQHRSFKQLKDVLMKERDKPYDGSSSSPINSEIDIQPVHVGGTLGTSPGIAPIHSYLCRGGKGNDISDNEVRNKLIGNPVSATRTMPRMKRNNISSVW